MKNKYFDILYEEGFTDEPNEIPEENILPYDGKADEKRTARVFRNVLLLIAGFSLTELLIALFFIAGPVYDFSNGKPQVLIGLLVGTALSVLWFVTIRIQITKISDPLDKNETRALRFGAVIRILVLSGILALAVFTDFMNPVAILIGAFNLKPASYIAGLIGRAQRKRGMEEKKEK